MPGRGYYTILLITVLLFLSVYYYYTWCQYLVTFVTVTIIPHYFQILCPLKVAVFFFFEVFRGLGSTDT